LREEMSQPRLRIVRDRDERAPELHETAECDAARTHDAICVDVRPVLDGPRLDQPVDENSPESIRAVADALLATRLPELSR
jgi:hypothetical protein